MVTPEMASKPPRVALLIETATEYGRGLLRGVIRYQREHVNWSISFHPTGLGDGPPTWFKDWQGDGILLRSDNRRLLNAVVKSGIPTVELRFVGVGSDRAKPSRATASDATPFPTVGVDNRAVVKLAFDHLWDRGFRNFAFCGLPRRQNEWMDYRSDCFEQLVQQAGGQCSVFQTTLNQRPLASRGSVQQTIADWIAGLSKPVGVMTCNDHWGQQLLDACRWSGVSVPDEVAVIGVDNDELLCNLSSPPLTSVDVGVERVGYEAATLLQRQMAGRRVAHKPKFLTPVGVFVRRSTDVIAIEDRELAEVVRDIRQHACEGIRVIDVIRRSRLSQSTIQRRFKTLLGRTPKEELTRVKLERVKHLLAETDLPISAIAYKCGFTEPKRLSIVFHAKLGITPAAYRRQQSESRLI